LSGREKWTVAYQSHRDTGTKSYLIDRGQSNVDFTRRYLYLGCGVTLCVWSCDRTHSVAASTNYVLFAVVIMLFALVLKLVSNLDLFVLIIALLGLGVGLYGVTREPH